MYLRLARDHGADTAARVLGEIAAVALSVEPGLAVRSARLGVHREVRAADDAVARGNGPENERSSYFQFNGSPIFH